MNKIVFQDRLKQSIQDRGITQRMLATLTGTTEVSISRWANGSRLPNTDALYKLCKALDVSADYLLGLSNEKVNNMDALKAELLEKIRKLWEDNNAGKGTVGAVEPAKAGGDTAGGNQETV